MQGSDDTRKHLNHSTPHRHDEHALNSAPAHLLASLALSGTCRDRTRLPGPATAAARRLLFHTSKPGAERQRRTEERSQNHTNQIPPAAPSHTPTLALLPVNTSPTNGPRMSRQTNIPPPPSNRALRHWTIHRAWQLYQSKLRNQQQLDLEKQYRSMSNACEALRLIDNQGLTAEERLRLGEGEAEGNQMGKLYRIAMQKKGIWDGVPIEYARIQTDTPPKDGWNHSWTR
ncbi:hypothetical protein Q7P37_010190 [Cladosporium fusiforme]